MCTLIVRYEPTQPWPLIIAANRDEVRTRPASGPRRWPREDFVAPRDEQALGTWLGLTKHGLFVGVTNRYPSPRHPERRSRGLLVVDALRESSARSVHLRLASIDPREVNSFHLLYADARDAFVTWSDSQTLHQLTLEPGVHVVTERSLGGDDHARVELIRANWPADPEPEALMALLARQKPDDPTGGVCVDLPEINYGTRSAFIAFLRPGLSESRVWWADGPPGVAPFIERADLIAALKDSQWSTPTLSSRTEP